MWAKESLERPACFNPALFFRLAFSDARNIPSQVTGLTGLGPALSYWDFGW